MCRVCLGVHPVCATPPDHGHVVVEGEVGINILWTGGEKRDERKIEIERVRVRLTVVLLCPGGGAPLDGAGGVGDAGGSRSRRGINANPHRNTRERKV